MTIPATLLADLTISGEITEIRIGADNPEGFITPSGALIVESDGSVRTLEGFLLLSGSLLNAIFNDCIVTTYDCIEPPAPADVVIVGVCEPVILPPIPELVLAGVIIPIGQLVQITVISEDSEMVFTGDIAPVGTLLGEAFLVLWWGIFYENYVDEDPILYKVYDRRDQGVPDPGTGPAMGLINDGDGVIHNFDGLNGHETVEFIGATGQGPNVFVDPGPAADAGSIIALLKVYPNTDGNVWIFGGGGADHIKAAENIISSFGTDDSYDCGLPLIDVENWFFIVIRSQADEWIMEVKAFDDENLQTQFSTASNTVDWAGIAFFGMGGHVEFGAMLLFDRFISNSEVEYWVNDTKTRFS